MEFQFEKKVKKQGLVFEYTKLFKGIYKSFISEIIYKKTFILPFIIIILFLIKHFDLFITTYFRENQNVILDFLANTGNFLGDGKFLFTFLLILTITFGILKNKRLNNLFLTSTCSVLAVSTLNLFFKGIVSRQRPYMEYNPHSFFSFAKALESGKLFSSDYSSFPSGHTISVTTLSVYLALNTKNIYLKFTLFLIPLITAFARVYSQVHWTSDVTMSYFLGTLFAISTFKYLNIKSQ